MRDSTAMVTVGSGEKLKVVKVGDKVGTVLQKDGTKKNIVLRNVKYAPDLNCNLLSLTQAIQAGFQMTGSQQGMWIRKGSMVYTFDHQFKSGTSHLMGMRIIDRTVSTNIDGEVNHKIKAHQMHSLLGHSGESYIRTTSARLGIKLQGPFPTCHSCALSNIT